MLPPGVDSVRDLSGMWWVAHTKARFEKAFACDLLAHDIDYFIPMVNRVRVTSGKKRRSLLPLFASYLFFCGTDKDHYTAMTTNRLCYTERHK